MIELKGTVLAQVCGGHLNLTIKKTNVSNITLFNFKLSSGAQLGIDVTQAIG